MSDTFDAYAAYYDLIYQDKDYAGEVLYIKKLLNAHGIATGKILELGCGTGKHAQLLAEHGFHITAVDISPRMIETAKRNAHTLKSGSVSYIVDDVRTVSTGQIHDAVISLFHVTSYQKTNSDLISMFESASTNLRKGGLFIFDFWYGPGVLTQVPTVRIKRIETDQVKITRIAEPNLRHIENTVEVNYNIWVEAFGHQRNELRELHVMRYLFKPELDYLLEKTGLKIISTYEWMSESEPSTDTWSAAAIAIKE